SDWRAVDMGAHAFAPKTETVSIAKDDLIAAWSLLERMVVSNDKIGSYFAHPVGSQQPAEQRQKMLEALFEYFGPEFFEQVAKVRSRLDRYVDDDEGERISDSLEYWKSK